MGVKCVLAVGAAAVMLVAGCGGSSPQGTAGPSPSPMPWTGELSYEPSDEFWDRMGWDDLAAGLGVDSLEWEPEVEVSPSHDWSVSIGVEAPADVFRDRQSGHIRLFIFEEELRAYSLYRRFSGLSQDGSEVAVDGWWAEGVESQFQETTANHATVASTFAVYDQNLSVDVSWSGRAGPDEEPEAALGRFREMALALLTEAIGQIRCRPLAENVSTAHCLPVG